MEKKYRPFVHPIWQSGNIALFFFLIGLLFSTACKSDSGKQMDMPENTAAQRLEIVLGKARISAYKLDNEAVKYAEAAYLLADSTDNTRAMAEAAMLSGIAWKIRGDMAQSLVRLFQAAQLYHSVGDSKEIARVLRETGETYRASALYDKALVYLYEALALEKKDSDPAGYAYTSGRLAATYLEVLYTLDEYTSLFDGKHLSGKEANAIIDSVAKIKAIADSCRHYIRLTDSLATKYALQNLKSSNTVVEASFLLSVRNHTDALDLLSRAEQEIKLYGPENELPLVYYNKANVLFHMKCYDQAIRYAELCFELSKKLNIRVYHILVAGLLTRVYAEIGEYRAAYDYQKEFYRLRETYFLTDIEIKRQSYISEAELQSRRKELQFQKTQRYYFGSLFILVAISLSVFLVFYYRKAKQHKHLNHELSARNQLIQGQNRQLAEMNAEKDKFFSIIAHDLRSPFGAMLGITELMADRDSDYTLNDMKDLALSLNETARTTFTLVENLLEWSRLQRGLLQPEPAMLNVKEIAGDCLTSIRNDIQSKNIGVEMVINENICVYGDLRMIQAALRNILSNAVKFTPKGGKVSLSAYQDNQTVRISVSDTGIGIPGNLQPTLFSFDDRKTRKGTEGEKSTGLGLTLSQEFIERNRGRIEFESIEGQGSTFSLVLSGTEWT